MITTVCIGSQNQIKVEATARVLRRYTITEGAAVRVAVVGSGVADQPRGLDSIWLGARNRAYAAYRIYHADGLGVGLESGIFDVRGWLDVCVCVLVDRDGIVGVGLSSAFEVPPRVLDVMNSGLEMCDAFAALGLAPADYGRNGSGASGVVTRDRVTRSHQVEQAVTMAMSRLDYPEVYRR